IPFSGAKESFISLSSLKKYFISFPATFPIPQLHLQVEFRHHFIVKIQKPPNPISKIRSILGHKILIEHFCTRRDNWLLIKKTTFVSELGGKSKYLYSNSSKVH
ncbi:MAG: hypothetical protein SNG45_05415, partial [Rikenellaceae bacterium]